MTIEIIADRHSVSVLPAEEFAELYDRGYRFPGFFCQACRAWHYWQGQGQSPCLTESLLRRRPPEAASPLAQQALNADWFWARKLALLQDARAVSSAARKAGYWEQANAMTLASYKTSAALEGRMKEAIRKAATRVAASVTRKGFDFRTARHFWVGHILGESWVLFPEPESYRMEPLCELLYGRTGCTPETALAIARGALSLLRSTAR